MKNFCHDRRHIDFNLERHFGRHLGRHLEYLSRMQLSKKNEKKRLFDEAKAFMKLKVPEHSENKFVYTYFL